MGQTRTRGELFFVLASSLICLSFLFAVIMPKVQANRAARRHLDSVVAETTAIYRNAQDMGKRGQALRSADPFFVTTMLRWYLELQGQPWPAAATGSETHAGHPQPGRS